MREDQLAEIIAQGIDQEMAIKAVEALVQTLGGESIYIPTGDESRRNARNRDIRRLFEDGVPVSCLAERFLISEWQVRRVLSS